MVSHCRDVEYKVSGTEYMYLTLVQVQAVECYSYLLEALNTTFVRNDVRI